MKFLNLRKYMQDVLNPLKDINISHPCKKNDINKELQH